ncbi:ribose-5-phosphate isomerase RpiA [Stakelama sediminis]|uniref:Ribose-5-phosphate isomerase A n=1 Tax=Stakelama sediminis TaxID=463200 RepID=A0A840YWK6_9SPHN|nr:ribose-5-phosphate isomerase RpiA [Stakelama sediminis]MBB5717940.1 ribose 5-phosphate isomerase A [Stakelama sediminis]
MIGADPIDTCKRAAAEAAVAQVRDGMAVGLGSGTTAAFAIKALGRRVADGLTITAAATSGRSADLARASGIVVRDFATLATLDIAIDGVDEIDPDLRAIKGAGGALLREKIIATAATRMIAIADDRKPVARLGHAALPVEILPFATAFVTARIEALGGQPVLRMADGAPYRTDQGNPILDCRFPDMADPQALADALATLPGVLAHGLFLTEIDELSVAGPDGVDHRKRG